MQSARTIPSTFLGTVHNYANQVAIREMKAKSGQEGPNYLDRFDQVTYTWNDYSQKARGFAKALMAQQGAERKVVAIQGANSANWLFANLGAIMAGGISAGVYPTNNDQLSRHVAKNSDAAVVVVENEEQLKKYVGIESTALKCFVVWNNVQNESLKQALPRPVYTWDEFIEQGKEVADEALDQVIQNQQPDSVCSLIYTSGTTGLPKAAALTHDNLTWTSSMAGRKFSLDSNHKGLSYLPLSHIAAQQLDCIVPMTYGYSIDIAPPDALKANNLKQHIVHTRPTYFLAVPRVWEKFKEGIEQKLQEANCLKRFLFTVGTTIGGWASRKVWNISAKEPSEQTYFDLAIHKVASVALSVFDRLLFTPVKAAMGLDRTEIAASGAGTLDQKVIDFFAGLNIRIIDIFGMSETSGPITISQDPRTPRGSSGRALEETQMMISTPDEQGEGEIMIKGRNVFKEYWANPEATQESFDADGFFHTGDKGKIDAAGNLFITGRIKELIKTSGGENIPPVRIEQKILQEIPLLSQAVVIGDKQKFLTCLVSLKTEQEGGALTTEALGLLQNLGSQAKTVEEAMNDPVVREYIKQGIVKANKQADSAAQYVQKFDIVPEEFSIANGLMTPTLKLKRSEIVKRYADTIATLYQE